jgi:hypothetical protein
MLVFFSNKLSVLLFLLIVMQGSSCLCANDAAKVASNAAAAKAAKKQIAKVRHAYQYVQKVLSPPEQESAEMFEDPYSMKNRLMQALRLSASAGASLLSSEVLMFLIRRIPYVSGLFDEVDRKIKYCRQAMKMAKGFKDLKNTLHQRFVSKGQTDYAKQVDAAEIPDFEQKMYGLLETKSSLEDLLAWIKKGLSSGSFFAICAYMTKKNTADWTYKSILENVIAAWPEHQYYFPKELRPKFQFLYDIYIARHTKLEMNETDAQRFIEWTCLEVIDALMLL